jgi:hypothetical protein
MTDKLGYLGQHAPVSSIFSRSWEKTIQQPNNRYRRLKFGTHYIGPRKFDIDNHICVGLEIHIRPDVAEDAILSLCEQVLLSSCGAVRRIPVPETGAVYLHVAASGCDYDDNEMNENGNTKNENKVITPTSTKSSSSTTGYRKAQQNTIWSNVRIIISCNSNKQRVVVLCMDIDPKDISKRNGK